MKVWTQVFGAVAASLNAASGGAAICFSAVLIHQLREDEDLKMDLHEASWIPTILMISSMMASFMGGWFSDRFGRRACIITWQTLALFCCIATYFAPNKWILYAARGGIGFANGLYYPIISVYVSETVHKSLRNAIGCLPSMFLAMGMLSSYMTGYFFHWRTCALIATFIPTLCVISMLLCPESPYWLVEQGLDSKAKKSLAFFRGKDYESELQDILFLHKRKLASNRNVANSSFWKSCATLKTKSFLQPFSCVGTLYGICQFGGIPILILFMPGIFEQAGSTLDSFLASTLVMSIRVVTAGFASFVVHHVQKKYVFVFCSWCVGLSMATLAVFNFVKTLVGDSEELLAALEHLQWIPVAAAITAMVSHSLGVVNVLHIMAAESFPTEIRSFASGILQTFFSFLNVMAIKTYPLLLEYWGFNATFGFYAGMCFLMGLWGLWKIEQNDGLSLTEIERRLDKDGDDDPNPI